MEKISPFVVLPWAITGPPNPSLGQKVNEPSVK